MLEIAVWPVFLEYKFLPVMFLVQTALVKRRTTSRIMAEIANFKHFSVEKRNKVWNG